ncbi:MAG: cation diffusion facilitator family transporter [Propionicimonas sp.]
MTGHSHGHGHSHVPSHAGARHRWRLLAAFCLTLAFFVVELGAAWLSGSLALLSDAGHMATDVVALGTALAATQLAARPDTTGRRTYGSYRAEVFASGFTVLLMLGVASYVVVEAIGRIGAGAEVATGPMLLVGVLGLVINLVSLWLLRGGARESLNVKGAYLEVLADSLGSVGVIAAALLIGWTGSPLWDTVIALAIGGYVAVRAVLLGREVLAVLGQQAPDGIDPAEVAACLTGAPGVADVHDLHLWTLTSGMNVATAHVVAAPGSDPGQVLEALRQVLLERFGIDHATLQVESDASGCELSW